MSAEIEPTGSDPATQVPENDFKLVETDPAPGWSEASAAASPAASESAPAHAPESHANDPHAAQAPAAHGEAPGKTKAKRPAPNHGSPASSTNTTNHAGKASTSTSAPASPLLPLAGIGLALAGIGVAAAPHLSSSIASKLGSGAYALGACLIVGGLVLFVGGLLARTLAKMRASLDTLGSETARLGPMASENRRLGTALEHLQSKNQEVKDGIVDVRKQLDRLAELAADPNYTVSVFRLAASVDQLGARLDVLVKEQFKIMREQITNMTERTEQADTHARGMFRDLDNVLRTQLEAQRHTLSEGFERGHELSTRACAAIDQGLIADARIEGRLQEYKDSLTHSVESLGADCTRSAALLNAAVGGLGARVEERLHEQGAAAEAHFERIDGAIDRSGRERDTLARELSERMSRELSGHSAELEKNLESVADVVKRVEQTDRKLVSVLADLDLLVKAQHQAQQLALEKGLRQVQAGAARADAGIEASREAAERLAQKLDEYKQSLTASVESIQASWNRSANTLHAGINDLGGRLDQRIEEQAHTLDRHFGAIDGALERAGSQRDAHAQELSGHLERIHGSLRHADEQHEAQTRELGAHFELLEGAVERTGTEHASHASQLASHLERIDGALARTGKEHGEQAREVREHLQRIDGAFERAGEERASRSQQLGQHFERLEREFARHSSQLLEGLDSIAQQIRIGSSVEDDVLALIGGIEVLVREQHQSQLVALDASLRQVRLQECTDALSGAAESIREGWAHVVDALQAQSVDCAPPAEAGGEPQELSAAEEVVASIDAIEHASSESQSSEAQPIDPQPIHQNEMLFDAPLPSRPNESPENHWIPSETSPAAPEGSLAEPPPALPSSNESREDVIP